jgi:head-tail adaptor
VALADVSMTFPAHGVAREGWWSMQKVFAARVREGDSIRPRRSGAELSTSTIASAASKSESCRAGS